MTEDTYPGTPKWVKRLIIALIVLAVLVLGVLLAVGGEHGPMQHGP